MQRDSGRLKDGLSADQALDILWAMTGSDLHQLLVVHRHWAGSRYAPDLSSGGHHRERRQVGLHVIHFSVLAHAASGPRRPLGDSTTPRSSGTRPILRIVILRMFPWTPLSSALGTRMLLVGFRLLSLS